MSDEVGIGLGNMIQSWRQTLVVGIGCALLCGSESGCGSEDGRDAPTAAVSGIPAATAGETDSGPEGDTSDDSSGEDSNDSPPDTEGPPSGDPCMGVGSSVDFSYIWISNSPEGTVSKIDTQSAVEVARYRTGPGEPDPSRTSVNLDGDVAVLNRAGGISKIAAVEERCRDLNGNGAIETSRGPDEILDWGTDECVLWYQDLPFVEDPDGGTDWGPRPIAWDQGEVVPDGDACMRTGETVWVGWYTGLGPNTGAFRRLDGESGATINELEVPDWAPLPLDAIRPYGGAIDASGDFWALSKGNKIVRIDRDTLGATAFKGPPLAQFYGLAMDANGEPWIGGCEGALYHVDLSSGQVETTDTTQGCLRGLQIDREGRGWIVANDPCRLVEFDADTGTITNSSIALPSCETPVGVSIDVEGFVWVVDKDANKAFKVDPDTHTIAAEVGGLVSPYTYSDMTGAGLRLVSIPEG
jgi:streptogramin lyase